MTLEAHVENGQIVLDEPAQLPEGAKVRIEVVVNPPAAPEKLERTSRFCIGMVS